MTAQEGQEVSAQCQEPLEEVSIQGQQKTSAQETLAIMSAQELEAQGTIWEWDHRR